MSVCLSSCIVAFLATCRERCFARNLYAFCSYFLTVSVDVLNYGQIGNMCLQWLLSLDIVQMYNPNITIISKLILLVKAVVPLEELFYITVLLVCVFMDRF